MTFQIRHDGKTFTVHTKVGDGLTEVLFDEDPTAAAPQQPQQAQPEEVQHGH